MRSVRWRLALRVLVVALVGAACSGPAEPVLYVANYSDGTVVPITVGDDVAGAPIEVGLDPSAVAVTPDGATAYVTNNNRDGTVTPVPLAGPAAGAPIKVGLTPVDVAITPDGATAYVADYGSDTVTPITVETNSPGSPVPVGRNPTGLAIVGTPSG